MINISGGVSGAITDENTYEAQKYAIEAYERIRNEKYDINRIVRNTGFDRQDIKTIKDYLFYEKILEDENGNLRRFDPDFYIAQSWTRLSNEPSKIQNHDITLINHELMEMKLIESGYSQYEAHNITSEKYNYNVEAQQYYHDIEKKQKRKGKETELTTELYDELDRLRNEMEKREDIRQEKERKKQNGAY